MVIFSILLLSSETASINFKNKDRIDVNLLKRIVNNDNGKTIFDTYGIKNKLFKKPIILISYDIFIMIGILAKKEIILILNNDDLLLFSL
jgi:hypothetical protein